MASREIVKCAVNATLQLASSHDSLGGVSAFGNDFAAVIMSAGSAHMMRALGFTAIGAFDMANRLQASWDRRISRRDLEVFFFGTAISNDFQGKRASVANFKLLRSGSHMFRTLKIIKPHYDKGLAGVPFGKCVNRWNRQSRTCRTGHR